MAGGVLDNSRERPILPEWTEKYLVPDSAFVRAYDASAPQYRAALKTALALHAFVSSLSVGSERHERSGYRSGFKELATMTPASWAALVFPDKYLAAARVFSVAILSLLADCGVSFVISVGASPQSHILNAIEMCGMENVFAMSRDKTSRVLDEMTKSYGAGRVVALDSPSLAEIVDRLDKSGRAIYEEKTEPRLLLADPDSFSLPLLDLAQGFIPPAESEPEPYAVYGARPEDEMPPCSLLLRPGLECYWRFEGLTIDFFMNRRFSYSLI